MSNIIEQQFKARKGCGKDTGAPVGHRKTMNGKPTFKNSDGCSKYPPEKGGCEECYKHQPECTWNA